MTVLTWLLIRVDVFCRDDLNTLYAEDDNAVAMSQDSRSLLIRRLTSIRGRAFDIRV